MTIQEMLLKGTEILKAANIEAPVVEAGVILCHVLGCDRSYLYTHGDQKMTEAGLVEFLDKVDLRSKGLPVQYITGFQEFMSLDFKVTPDTLIPRHDTEVLVETVIDHVKKLQENKKVGNEREVRILDIGTGSGCIAISLAYYLKNCFVTAVDISSGALDIARLNAMKNGVDNRISFLEANVFNNINAVSDEASSFDIIVSNPPYIPTEDISELQIEVKDYEPITALDGGTDGLDFYRRIVEVSREHLKKGGLLALEVGYDQAGTVCELMSEYFYDIGTVKDISGIERVVKGLLV